MSPPSRRASALAQAAAGLFGFCWAGAWGLWQVMPPGRLGWMTQGDWSPPLFGWLFARANGASLPVGQAPGLLHPFGSSLAFTDGIPWVGGLASGLSFALPEAFQYFGLWLVSCFVLQGVVGARVALRLTSDAWTAGLLGCLCALAPVLPARMGHLSLCAQWVVLAAVGLHLVELDGPRAARRVAIAGLGLLAFSCGVHLYLAAMTALVVLALMARLAVVERTRGTLERFGLLLAVPVTALASLWLAGFFTGPRAALGAEGFGDFSANLFTLVDPSAYSRYFGALPSLPRQGEGYGYLGVGVLALLAAHLVLLGVQRPFTRAQVLGLLPLALAALLAFAYALSFRVTAGARVVADLSALYAPLAPLTEKLRSSGRFVWVLDAALTALALGVVARFGARRWLSRAVALAAVALQLGEVNFSLGPFHVPQPELATLQSPEWKLMRGDYRHLALHPVNLQWVCRYEAQAVVRLSYLAYQLGLSINSGHVGRVPVDLKCEQHLAAQDLDPQTVYFPLDRGFLTELQQAGEVCGALEGGVACVSGERATPFRAVLERAPVP